MFSNVKSLCLRDDRAVSDYENDVVSINTAVFFDDGTVFLKLNNNMASLIRAGNDFL